MKTKMFLLFLCIAVVLSAAGCASSGGSSPSSQEAAEPAGTAADGGSAVFESHGLTLTVPENYRDLVIVRTDADDLFFSVWEKESVEAAGRQHAAKGESAGPDSGEGWLFGITSVSESKLHEMLCEDMSGTDVFARAANGTAYLYVHPTDVRLVRDGDDAYGQEDLAEWAFVHQWVSMVPDLFTMDNGLTAFRRSNTNLDITLSRILFRGDKNYELTSLAHGTFAPDPALAKPYLEALTSMTYEWADNAETPDGEYIVLRITDEDTRFDFFLGGDGSYVREVRDGEYENLYRASGGADVTSPVRDWYNALAEANGKSDYDYEAYDTALQAVLDEYAALDIDALENYDENAHPELPWYTAAIANTVRNDLYYGFYDFDGNDVPELIIAAGDDSWQVPEAVYAFDGTAMRYLCSEHALGERASLTWNGDLFAVHGSGGAAVGSVALYRIAADGFSTELIEVMDYEFKDADTVVYTPELGNMTAEEFIALDLGNGVAADIEYTLFASCQGGGTGIGNPWSEAATAGEAAQSAGLDGFTIPEVYACFPEGHSEPFIRWMNGMAEAVIDDADDHLVLRKGIGSDDISGDWNMYDEERDINWKGLTIHCRGTRGEVRTAWWSFGGNAFSLSFNIDDLTLPGLSEDEVTSLVNQIQ